ncbi:hypothetical protein HELRODRAFT_184468, partial [Helobdella robusta]|uniref:Uncharacterized protein n=1 Tax=Helobdella robusta TaxID=6412 RepID=T1FL96_HELRO
MDVSRSYKLHLQAIALPKKLPGNAYFKHVYKNHFLKIHQISLRKFLPPAKLFLNANAISEFNRKKTVKLFYGGRLTLTTEDHTLVWDRQSEDFKIEINQSTETGRGKGNLIGGWKKLRWWRKKWGKNWIGGQKNGENGIDNDFVDDGNDDDDISDGNDKVNSYCEDKNYEENNPFLYLDGYSDKVFSRDDIKYLKYGNADVNNDDVINDNNNNNNNININNINIINNNNNNSASNILNGLYNSDGDNIIHDYDSSDTDDQ